MSNLAKTEEPNHFDEYRNNVEAANYQPFERAVLLRLVDVMERRDLSQSEVARQVKHGTKKQPVSPTTINQLLSGKYPSKTLPLVQSIQTFINVQTGRELFRDGGFVETRLYHHVEKMADLANTLKRITVIHGGIMAGKTINAEALHLRYNRANTLFISCPRADTYGGFVKRLSAVLGLTPKGSLSDHREAILGAIQEDHLLIVDEFHQPACTFSYSQALRVYNFIAEINELSHCGVLLIGDTEGYETLRHGVGYEHIAERIRGGLDIVAKPRDLRPGFGPKGEEDIKAICRAFGMPMPSPTQLETCRQLITTRSVANLFDLLILARAAAKNRDEILDWSHVISGNKQLLQLN